MSKPERVCTYLPLRRSLRKLIGSVDDIPEGLFRQMTTCQTAANEFLRQFWSSMYPASAEVLQTVNVATPAQRAAKAAKMIGYLSKTPEKVHALIRAAQVEGVDPTRVEIVRTCTLKLIKRLFLIFSLFAAGNETRP